MKPFWRETNIWRLAGLIVMVVAEYLEKSQFDLMGFKFQSNVIQFSGLIAFFYPMIREGLNRVYPKQDQ